MPSWLPPGRYTRSIAAKRWIVIIMQGCLLVDSTKALVVDLYAGWKIWAKQYDKEGSLFAPQNVRKRRRAKMDLPSSRFQPQLLLVKSTSTWDTFPLHGGPKLALNRWIGCLLGSPVLSSKHLRINGTKTNIELTIRARTGQAPTPSPKIISVLGPKNEPKTSPFTCLSWRWQSFPF